MEKKESGVNRREFLKSGLVATGALALVGAGVFVMDRATAETRVRSDFLRPPGAVKEKDFIYGCIKCGLCVQICPVQAINLAKAGEGLAFGTPYIDPRDQACDFSCDALQCVEVCPTAVLDFTGFKQAGVDAVEKATLEAGADFAQVNPFEVQKVAMKQNVKMGKARVISESCLAHAGAGFKGISRGESFKGVYRAPNSPYPSASPLADQPFEREICDLCITECPIGEIAIIQEENRSGKLVPKVLDGCTGCGVCVMICPTQEPSIIVEPN